MSSGDWAAPYKTADGLPITPVAKAEDAGLVLAGPIAGGPMVPTFRKLLSSDLPAGTPQFGGFTSDGVLYANGEDSIASTLPGSRYHVLTANEPGVPPSFQGILLEENGISGTLPVSKGGTGKVITPQKTFFSGPSTGSDQAPRFRLIELTDLPTLEQQHIQGIVPVDKGGTGVVNAPPMTFFAGPNAPGNVAPPVFRGLVENDIPALSLQSSPKFSGILPVSRGGTGAGTALQSRFLASPVHAEGALTLRGLDPFDLPIIDLTGYLTLPQPPGASQVLKKIFSGTLPNEFGGLGVDLRTTEPSAFLLGPKNDTFFDVDPGPPSFRKMDLSDVKHLASPIGLSMNATACNYIAFSVDNFMSANNIASVMTLGGVTPIANTMDGNCASIILGKAPVYTINTMLTRATSTGADPILANTTAAAVDAFAKRILGPAADSIAAAMTSTGALSVATAMGAPGSSKIVQTMDEAAVFTIAQKMNETAANTVAQKISTVGANSILSRLNAAAGNVLLGPISGTGSPSFRRLNQDDLPDIIPQSHGGTGVKTTSANWVLAGPQSVGVGEPMFRHLVLDDLPLAMIPVEKGGTGANSVAGGRVFAGPPATFGAPYFRKLEPIDVPDIDTLVPAISSASANYILSRVTNVTPAFCQLVAMAITTLGANVIFAKVTKIANETAKGLAESLGDPDNAPGFSQLANKIGCGIGAPGMDCLSNQVTEGFANSVLSNATSVGTGAVAGSVPGIGGAATAGAVILTVGAAAGAGYLAAMQYGGSAAAGMLTGGIGWTWGGGIGIGGAIGGGAALLATALVNNNGEDKDERIDALADAMAGEVGACDTIASGMSPTGVTFILAAAPPVARHAFWAGSYVNDEPATPIFRRIGPWDLPTMTQPIIGGVLYAHSVEALAYTSVGAAGHVLHGGTTPYFGPVVLDGVEDVTGVLPVTRGGTGVGGTVSARTVFAGPAIDAGTPTWRQLNVNDISGTLPITSGGTGTTFATGSGNVVLQNSPLLLGTLTAGLGIFTTTTPAAYALDVRSSAATGNTMRVFSSSTQEQACIMIENPSGIVAIGQSGSANVGVAGTSQSYIQPSAKGLLVLGSLKATALSGTTGTFTGAVTAPSIALTTPLAITSGGTGSTTATGTGSNVLSVAPTLTGTTSAAALTLTTPLGITSGGTGASTATGTGSLVLSASPTLTGNVVAGALTLNTPLPIASGGSGSATVAQNAAFLGPLSGTGAPSWRAITSADIPMSGGGTMPATSTGTGSMVLQNSPTLTGTLTAGLGTFTTTTSTAYALTAKSTATTGNTMLISSASTLEQTSLMIENTSSPSAVLNIGQTGVTNPYAFGPRQSYIAPSSNGLRIIGNVGLGSAAPAAPDLSLVVATNAAGDAIRVHNTNAGGFATIRFQNNGAANMYIGLGGTGVGGGLANVGYILGAPIIAQTAWTFSALITAAAATFSGAVTAASQTINGLLTAASATINGVLAINSGTGRPVTITTSYTGGDSILLTNTNAPTNASMQMVNNAGIGVAIGVGGSTNANGTGYQSQPYIQCATNGLKIDGNISCGNAAIKNPGHAVAAVSSANADVVFIKNTNAGGFATINCQNNNNNNLYIGVGGSALGSELANTGYITGSPMITDVPWKFTSTIAQSQFMHTVITNWQSTGFVYQISSGSYVPYPIGAIGAYFFGPSGTVTNYGPLTVTPVPAGTSETPYWLMPVAGLYSVKWRWTPSPFYNKAVISRNIGNGTEFDNAMRGNPNILALSYGYYYQADAQTGAGLELVANYYATTTDKIYFGHRQGNGFQTTAQPQADGDTSWMLTFTLIQRTG